MLRRSEIYAGFKIRSDPFTIAFKTNSLVYYYTKVKHSDGKRPQLFTLTRISHESNFECDAVICATCNLKAEVDIRSVVKKWHLYYGNVSRKICIVNRCNPVLYIANKNVTNT